MSRSLIDSVRESLEADTIRRVATNTGVSEEAVVNGLWTALAAVLHGVVEKADDPEGLRQVFEQVIGGTSAPSGAASELDRHASQADPVQPSVEQGERLLSTIFGRNQSSVVERIGHQAAIPTRVVAEMMGIAAGRVLSFLATRVREQKIPFSAFRDLLLRESGDGSGCLPASVRGVPRSATPPLRNTRTTNRPRASADAVFLSRLGPPDAACVLSGNWPTADPYVREESSRSARRILAACLITGLLLGIFWLMRRSHAADVERSDGVSRARTSIPGLGRFIDRELPGDVRISIPENGMESKLISCIQDSSRTAGCEQWLDFDRLTFDANSAIPKAESEEQLANLASVLRAYPHVRLKVGGYTDNKGNRKANQRLSENRAESVRRELAGMGIDSSRVEAEGYGDQHPIADNATEQGRTKNRRISLKVLQK